MARRDSAELRCRDREPWRAHCLHSVHVCSGSCEPSKILAEQQHCFFATSTNQLQVAQFSTITSMPCML